ncbi:MAG TPA: 23S rRNA (adenine(2503)-C(2))-methyltransferase RlmN, partial [Mariniphaga sp.]|nr:23S rRNA (adenine(2503)-C(2))-methyltransferase RlmN [Mariniphaga sp.]
MKEKLFGKTLNEIQKITDEFGLPKFSAKQITHWLYKKQVISIEAMTNLSVDTRNSLAEKFEVGRVDSIKVQESIDGTKKYLFPTLGNKFIETAMIPEGDRITVCVSSQVGCKMGCLFCFT